MRDRISVALTALVVASLVQASFVAAQTGDPCASASPVASPIATPAAVAEAPSDAEAVLLALAIRQEQVVTALEIAQAGDGALADLADDDVDDARDHLAAIMSLLPADSPTDPARVVAVIDRLRQERDLPADAAALTVWEPGLAETTLCAVRDSERDAATIILLQDASLAIVDLTGLAEPLLPEHGELFADMRDAAGARIEALATLPVPPATPAG